MLSFCNCNYYSLITSLLLVVVHTNSSFFAFYMYVGTLSGCLAGLLDPKQTQVLSQLDGNSGTCVLPRLARRRRPTSTDKVVTQVKGCRLVSLESTGFRISHVEQLNSQTSRENLCKPEISPVPIPTVCVKG